MGGRALAHKIARLGFYWPNMLNEARNFVRKCERCQKHAPIVRQPPEMLTSINSPIPFAMWGMDILGPFPIASGQRKFLVVAIDYFTKWIEAKPLAKITTKQIAHFFWKALYAGMEYHESLSLTMEHNLTMKSFEAIATKTTLTYASPQLPIHKLMDRPR